MGATNKYGITGCQVFEMQCLHFQVQPLTARLAPSKNGVYGCAVMDRQWQAARPSRYNACAFSSCCPDSCRFSFSGYVTKTVMTTISVLKR